MRKLFLLMMAMMAIGSHADEISVEDVVLTEGESATTDICLTNTTEYIALQMDLTLPEGVVPDREGSTLTDRAASGMTLSIGKKKDRYTIIVSQAEAIPFSGTEGAVIHLKLNAGNSFDSGEATLSGIRVVNKEGQRIFLDDSTFLIKKNEPYAVLTDNEDGSQTLSFVFDAFRSEHEETTFALQTLEEVEPEWWSNGYSSNITRVVFDDSFAKAKPVTTHSWIREMPITSVEGLENLNTAEVKDMGAMFYHSSSLESLDLSHFDMTNANDVSYMLFGCSGLSYLSIPLGMENLGGSDCEGIGQPNHPCEIRVPEGFDFGLDDDVTSSTFYWKGGWFTKFLLGDVNHDGKVNVSDVMLTVNEVLGKRSDNFHFKNGDINGDNKITVSDVMQIVRIIVH